MAYNGHGVGNSENSDNYGENVGSFINTAFSPEVAYMGNGDQLKRRKSGNSNSLELNNGYTITNNENINNKNTNLKKNDNFNKKTENTHGHNNNNNNNNNPQQALDFDDILPMVGEFGLYQKILFCCMIPFAFFVAFVYFSQIFLTLIPDQHWCHVPELDGLPLEQSLALSIPHENGEYANCRMYDVDYTKILQQFPKMRQANKSWPQINCRSGWSYNFTEIPYSTVATEQNWVCDNAALPTYAQSIFFLGAIVGGLLFGWVADRFGRIPALIGSNLIGCLAGVGTAFSSSFWTFAIMRFFVGFAFDNCFTMMYILVLEYVGPKYRTFVANMSIAIFFTMASCSLPWIAYYLSNWKLLTIITSFPLAIALFTPLIVPESARWLVSQGRIEQAVSILKRVERRNGKHVTVDVYQNFTDNCLKLRQEENQHNNNYSVLDLFKTPRLRRTTLILITIWMAISLVFDGHVRNVGSLGLNIFTTFTVACFTELPANTLLTLTLDRWGRRWLACGTMVLSGIFSLLATVAPIGVHSASLAIAGRFFVNISYNIGLQYAAEILPTVVRAQGVAFVHIMGYVASIIAPFVVYLANISTALPLIILGVLGIIGGLLSLLLPETLNHDLPQTLTDGEEFGRGQSIWDFPCLAKNVDVDCETTNQNFVRSHGQTGASLNASTGGAELRSSILRRSATSHYSSRL